MQRVVRTRGFVWQHGGREGWRGEVNATSTDQGTFNRPSGCCIKATRLRECQTHFHARTVYFNREDVRLGKTVICRFILAMVSAFEQLRLAVCFLCNQSQTFTCFWMLMKSAAEGTQVHTASAFVFIETWILKCFNNHRCS